jgi:hypothetical protein
VLLSIKDAAAVLNQRSPGSLYRKIRDKELPVVMVDGQRMVERDGLEDLWDRINRVRRDSPRPPGRPPAPSARADTIPSPQGSGPAPRKRTNPTAAPPPDPGEVPNYNEERAWHEREKRLIAELQRRREAGELVYKADVEQAQMAIALTLKNQLEALPKQIKQQLPHLSISDEEMIERLVAKVLTAVADWRMDQEEEE